MSQYFCGVCGNRQCQTLGAVCEGCRIQSMSLRPKGKRERFEGSCFYCGWETLVEMDHVVPVSRGGPGEEPWNQAPACFLCNGNKSDRLPSEWCPSHKSAVEIEKRVPTIYPRMRFGFLLGNHEQAYVRIRSLCANFAKVLVAELNALPSEDRKRAITLHRAVEKLRIRTESVIYESEDRGHNSKMIPKKEFRHSVPLMMNDMLCARCRLTHDADVHFNGDHKFENENKAYPTFVEVD